MDESYSESFYEDKRRSWSATETECFLTIVKELNVIRLMDGKKFRTSDIFKKVEELFEAKGYKRTAAQLLDKFKAMKKRFISARNAMSKSGAGTAAKKQCAFYDELDDIFSCRPTLNQTGVDSTVLPSVLDDDSSGYYASDNTVLNVISKQCSTPKTKEAIKSTAGCSYGPTRPSERGKNPISYATPKVSSISDHKNDRGSSSTSTSSSCVSNAHHEQLYTHSSKKLKTCSPMNRETPRSGLKNVMNDFAYKMIKSQNEMLEKMLMEQRQSDNNMMMQYNEIFTQQTQMLLAGLRSLGQSGPTNFVPIPVSPSIPSATVMFPNTPLHDTYGVQSSNTWSSLPQVAQADRISDHPQSPVTAFTTSPPVHSIRPRVTSQKSLIKTTIVKSKKKVDQQPPPIATTPSFNSDNYSSSVLSSTNPVNLICGDDDADSDLNFEDVEFLDLDV